MNKTIEDAKLFDYDKFLIIILPIISLLLFIFVNEEIALLFGLVISSILVYELIIYNERFIYGFNGLRILSFPSLLLFSYTIFISIPSIFVITKTTNEIENMYFFSILSFYILFPIGLLTSKYLWDINIDKISKMYYMKIKKSEYDHIFYKLLIHLLILCFALLFLYLIRIKKIPLLEMIKNPKSYAYMWALREEAFKLLEVNIIEKYLYSWNRDLFYPLGIVGSLFLCILYKENKYKVLFIIFLVTGLINNAITTAKAPVAQIFLSLISFYFLKEGKIKFKYIVLGLLLIFAFPIVIYYFTTNPLLRNTETILNALFYRVFLAPADVLYQYYKIFPSMHEFLLGRSTKLFSWLFEDGTFNIANYVAKIWWRMPFTTGFANAIYLGSAWADFGLVGVIFFTLLLGFLTNLFQQKLLEASNYKKNVIYVMLVSGLVMNFTFSFISANYTVLIVSKGLFLCFIFVLLLIDFQKYYKAKIKI